jgi:hypothetical protein
MVKLPILQFFNPVFHIGRNVTVRKGTKWANEVMAVVLGDANTAYVVPLVTHVQPFNLLTDKDLVDEHDPGCRTVAGLLADLQRAYPGFKATDEVTVVKFILPADYVQPSAGAMMAAAGFTGTMTAIGDCDDHLVKAPGECICGVADETSGTVEPFKSL